MIDDQKAKSRLIKKREEDARPLNRLTMGALWRAIIMYRKNPRGMILFLLYLLIPEDDMKEHHRFLMQAVGTAWTGIEEEYLQFTKVLAFKATKDRILADLGYTQGTGVALFNQARDDALKEIVSSDPHMFLRRARALSRSAEVMMNVVQMMLSGGGFLPLGGGGFLEVPALQLRGDMKTVKALVSTSNSLFTQVAEEIVEFDSRQKQRDREMQKGLDEADGDYMMAIFAAQEMKWTPAQIKNRLGIAIVEDANTEEIELKKVEGKYVVQDDESDGGL